MTSVFEHPWLSGLFGVGGGFLYAGSDGAVAVDEDRVARDLIDQLPPQREHAEQG